MSRSELRPAVTYDARNRARRWVGQVPWLALGLVVALVAKHAQCRAGGTTCERVAAGDVALTIVTCREQYARTGDPSAGVRLANALRRHAELDEAARVARELLATPAQSDAFFVLGKVAATQMRYEDAGASLRLARALHTSEGRWREVGKDLLAAAEVAVAGERFAEALALSAECLHAAALAEDAVSRGYCHLGAAHVLTQLGYPHGARRELDAARAHLRGPEHTLWVAFEEGNLLRDRHELALAAIAFERALLDAGKVSYTPGVISAHLNLAEVHLEQHDVAQAKLHLDAVDALAGPDQMAAERALLRARLRAARGDLEGAAHALDAASFDSRDDRVEMLSLRASLALDAGDHGEAERAAKAAIAEVELIRAAQPLAQLRSWAMEYRRAPYDTLFLTCARRGLAAQALEAFDRWRAVAAESGSLAEQGGLAAEGLAELAAKAQLLGKLAASSGATSSAASSEVRTSTPILAFVVAGGELWRIEVTAAGPRVAKLGALRDFERDFARLRSDPTDRATAIALGNALLPGSVIAATELPLRVTLDAPLALLPISFVYAKGRPLVAWRPVVLARRPLDTACAPRRPALGSMRVLADARGDLQQAKLEARSLSAAFGARVFVGREATRAALWGAEPSELLHLALHAEVDDTGGVLALSDGKASALEIAARGNAPRHVVLATCGSAIARGGTQSLAMAYLAAGAEQVIATTRPISDAGAALLAEELYRARTSDLVAALAAAQRAHLAEPGELVNFAVFGQPVCEDR